MVNFQREEIWERSKKSYLSLETDPFAKFEHGANVQREKTWERPIDLFFSRRRRFMKFRQGGDADRANLGAAKKVLLAGTPTVCGEE